MSQRILDDLHVTGTIYADLENDPQKLAQWKMRIAASLKAKNPDWDYETHRSVQLEMEFAATWVRSGEIVYNLSHSLAALFSLTSSPVIDWTHLPHAAFIIKVPRVFLPLPGTIEPEYSYLYVANNAVSIVADYDTTAYSHILLKAGTTETQSDFFERLNPEKAVQVIQSMRLNQDDARAAIRKGLEGAGLPESQLRIIVERTLIAEQQALEKLKAEAPTRIDAATIGINLLAMRFLSNTLVYLQEAQPGAVTSASSDAQRKPHFVDVLPPREVIVDRQFRDAAKAAVTATVAGSVIGVRRVLKHHVRGHWRNQAVGPAHSQRRRTWIYPHERGSQDFGTVMRRIETL